MADYSPKTTADKLAHLAEECAELAQVTCKALRFGLYMHHPDDATKETNLEAMRREFRDLFNAAVALDLVDL